MSLVSFVADLIALSVARIVDVEVAVELVLILSAGLATSVLVLVLVAAFFWWTIWPMVSPD